MKAATATRIMAKRFDISAVHIKNVSGEFNAPNNAWVSSMPLGTQMAVKIFDRNWPRTERYWPGIKRGKYERLIKMEERILNVLEYLQNSVKRCESEHFGTECGRYCTIPQVAHENRYYYHLADVSRWDIERECEGDEIVMRIFEAYDYRDNKYHFGLTVEESQLINRINDHFKDKIFEELVKFLDNGSKKVKYFVDHS